MATPLAMEDGTSSGGESGSTENEKGVVAQASGTVICLLCAVSALEGADQQLLGSCMLALEEDLHLELTSLGNMNLVQAMLQAVSAPIWGIVADRGMLSRRTILCIGCVGWGASTMLLALVTTWWPIIILRAVNGAMLACLRPISNGLVADVTPEAIRGKVYGQVQLSLDIGLMVTNLIATPLSRKSVLHIQGWRVAFGVIGLISLVMATLVGLFMKEPLRPRKRGGSIVGEECSRLGSLFMTPTFDVIILQGIFGIVPWSALGFMTLFFQTAGIPDVQAAMLSTAFGAAGGMGHFGGGLIGDALARKCPYHGRPFTAQLSVILSIPILYVIFRGITPGPDHFVWYLVLVMALGLTATWCAAGVNWPIFSEVVPAESRSAIIAWDTAIEGASGAFMGNFAVTHLARDVFGYSLTHAQSQAKTPENAQALGSALVWTTSVPFLVCMGFYSLLHWSYPRDLKRMKQEVQAEANSSEEYSSSESD